MSVRDEIQDALVRLKMPEAEFLAVPDHEAKALFALFLQQFTGGVDTRWWWERFTAPITRVYFEDGKAFSRISRVAPNPDDHVWFVAEDTMLPFYPVFSATPAAIEQVIGECYGFEYYLIAKDLSWLLCENHHDVLIAVGHVVQERLLSLT